MIDISVVIVNWNTRKYLSECIGSLLSQYQAPYKLEIIVVDNNSQDDSVPFIRENYPSVIVIQNTENMGFARANNQGFEVAGGRYICLVNSDILFLEDSISVMVNYMDRNAEVGVLGPRLLWRDRSLQGSCRKFPSVWNTLCPALGLTSLLPQISLVSGEHMVGFFKHDRAIDVDVLVGAFLMVRTSALSEVGGMDDQYFMYCEEVDWCRRFVTAGWKVRFSPQTEVVHYGGASSSIEPLRFFTEYCLSNLRYWQKHHSSASVVAYRLAMTLRYLIRLPWWAFLHRIRRTEETEIRVRTALTGLRLFMPMRRVDTIPVQFNARR